VLVVVVRFQPVLRVDALK